jgi:NADH-quinone oxidoreductase subunit B
MSIMVGGVVRVGAPAAVTDAVPVQVEVDRTTLRLHVVEAGLACCAVEQAAATALVESLAAGSSAGSSSAEGSSDAAASTDALDVLVVSGTVTDVMAPLLVRLYDAMAQPRAVVSFGACAATGGPYWDSYAVTNGADQLLPVDVYVPGCPPRPEAFVAGLRALVASRGAGMSRAVASPGDQG